MTDTPPLPTFDARLFEPPSWARDPLHAGMHGKQTAKGKGKGKETEEEKDKDGGVWEGDVVDPPEEPVDEDGAGVGVEEEDGELRFTLDELKSLATQAEKLKTDGNAHFLATPKRLDDARRCYLDAVGRLPDVPAPKSSTKRTDAKPKESSVDSGARIVELDDEQEGEEDEREAVHRRIRECARAVWGNLGAVYMATGEHKEAVEACTKALDIDPEYTKVLQRRAAANEAVGSWSSLTAAQDDYKRLIALLPRTSPQLPAAQRALAALPARIAKQQEKEKDEMLGKLKELGNGLLGKFGLSTDMFKFDQQPGGGYNVRFEK